MKPRSAPLSLDARTALAREAWTVERHPAFAVSIPLDLVPSLPFLSISTSSNVLGPGDDDWSNYEAAATEAEDAIGSGTYADCRIIARRSCPPYVYLAAGQTYGLGVVQFHATGNPGTVKAWCDGGSPVTVSTRTLNATTGLVEHWFNVRCDDFNTDGEHEVRLISYPVKGFPRVLGSWKFYTNKNGTITWTQWHASGTGNDTTGDGSEGNPYRTIAKCAIAHKGVGFQGSWGIAVLHAGSFGIGSAAAIDATEGYFVITRAVGVPLGDCLLDTTGDGLGVPRLCIDSVKLKRPGGANTGNTTGTFGGPPVLWLKGCTIDGNGRGELYNPIGDAGWTGGIYVTDTAVDDSSWGLTACTLVLNCTLNDVCVNLNNSALVANVTVTGDSSNPGIEDIHPDGYFSNGGTDNAILYNVKFLNSGALAISAQGNLWSDVALVNVLFGASAGNTEMIRHVFHMVVDQYVQANSNFQWGGYSAEDIDFTNVVFRRSMVDQWVLAAGASFADAYAGVANNHFLTGSEVGTNSTGGSDLATLFVDTTDFVPKAGGALVDRVSADDRDATYDLNGDLFASLDAIGAVAA